MLFVRSVARNQSEMDPDRARHVQITFIKKMIKLFQPYMGEEAIENMVRVAQSGQLAQGPEVELFEQEFADKFGFEKWQIVTLNSGTSALELAYELVGI